MLPVQLERNDQQSAHMLPAMLLLLLLRPTLRTLLLLLLLPTSTPPAIDGTLERDVVFHETDLQQYPESFDARVELRRDTVSMMMLITSCGCHRTGHFDKRAKKARLRTRRSFD